MLASTTLNLGSLGSQLLNSPTHKPLSPFLLPATKPFLKSSNPIGSSCWKLTTSVRTAVAAVDSSDPTEKEVEEAGSKEYHFVVANAKFMLDEEEHFNELLSERLRNYGERNKEQDFWLVIEPKFLDKFPNITKRLKRPAVALVSTNGPWIKYMKLRLDRVLQESFEADSLEEALASNPVNLEFEKPEKWTAPYPKYEYGWWEPFLPSKTSKNFDIDKHH
ncbi:Ycf54-like protein [Sesamum angolense]|uniref:Ycf54-like protein n=1 Tax=Sesamum angolense TaxID=2727404 RepID=A0AAE1XBK3_9LAMI|nr:Ycf54-like protein [Sesamum angolense]